MRAIAKDHYGGPGFKEMEQLLKIAPSGDFADLISHYLSNELTASGRGYRKALKERNVTEEQIRQFRVRFAETGQARKHSSSAFTFIDLFAGIGGMRLAGSDLGGKCVFTSEWDKYSQITYSTNFGEVPFGDITKISESFIPKHDLLMAGFPCQAFSIAGRKGGFSDTRGTLFFDVARILKAKRPKAFLLENVKGLRGHDKGRTLATILNVLREDLGYFVPEPQIINSRNFGVPQNRERIIIVGFKTKKQADSFRYPTSRCKPRRIIDILEKDEVSPKYYLSNQYLNTLILHRQRHEEKGHGFGYEIIQPDQVANAIVVGGMGRERNLVVDNRLSNFKPVTHIVGTINRQGIRRLTPREWARLQGFPESFVIPVSDAQAYKQFGNSVTVPAIKAVIREIIKVMNE